MATIGPRNPAVNPQLNGILASVPMPAVVNAYPNRVSVGATPGNGFVVDSNLSGTANGNVAIGGGGSVTAPEVGAQPAAPTAANAAGSTTPAANNVGNPVGDDTALPAVASVETLPLPDGAAAAAAATPAAAAAADAATTKPTSTGSPLAKSISGFGRANLDAPMRASIGGASFGFPSFKASAKKDTAPAIKWGPGWKKVQKDGLWYMQHSNGVRAVPATEYRITPAVKGKVQTIRVANGWGKKFPDGSILVVDRAAGPYVLDAKGNKKKIGLGTQTIGGVKVRIFEAAVVRTIDKNGKVDVFDSRGTKSTGTTRWTDAAVGTADAGASTVTAGGKTASGGGATTSSPTSADMVKNIDQITEVARGLVSEIRSGNVDPSRLASLQAQLATLPAAILQAAGAAGTITSTGSNAAATGGGAAATETPTPAPPTAGVDANAATKELAAGASVKLDSSVIPSDLKGMQARFGQLPDDLQTAVARAYGSNQGSKAFAADRLLAFDADGTVRVVASGTVYTRHQEQIRGAGPGEDPVMTMRPNRQPNSAAAHAAKPAKAMKTPTVTAHAASTRPHVSGGGAAAATTSSTTAKPRSISLFAAGAQVRHEDFGGLDGTYTWKTLPAKAKSVILSLLRSGSDLPAAKAYASRNGTGWAFDPNATITLEAGYASFPKGMKITRGGSAASAAAPTVAPVAGGTAAPAPAPAPAAAPSSQSGAHDATHPPVGPGSVGSGSAAAAPPMPNMPGMGNNTGSVGNA